MRCVVMSAARSRLLALALLALPLASCGGDGLTEVVIVVDSDLRVPQDIDEVFIEVTSPGGELQTSSAPLGMGQPRLPRTLGMSHEGGRLGPFTVRVLGRDGGGTLVSRTARFSFEPGESLRLRVFLPASCVAVTCDMDQTCTEAGCAGIDVPELEPWTGSVAALLSGDAGI